jgi:transposase, IS30 family
MSPYERFTREKREILAVMNNLDTHQYRMSEQLGFSQAAISQELKRNSINSVYDAKNAQELSESRKQRKQKPTLDDFEISNFIKKHLLERRSPEQISKLARKKGLKISRSSIYNFLEANSKFKKYRKHRKYRKRKKEISSKHGIPNRKSIQERPKESEHRFKLGHLEMDFVVGPTLACVLSFRDRKSRKVFFIKLENKTATNTFLAIKKALNFFREVRTISTDNDKSFVCHSLIESENKVETFFTRPSAPYEKGSIEQANKELRVFFPKRTDFKRVSQEDLDRVTKILNSNPMKVLDWKTPDEVHEEEFCLDSS